MRPGHTAGGSSPKIADDVNKVFLFYKGCRCLVDKATLPWYKGAARKQAASSVPEAECGRTCLALLPCVILCEVIPDEKTIFGGYAVFGSLVYHAAGGLYIQGRRPRHTGRRANRAGRRRDIRAPGLLTRRGARFHPGAQPVWRTAPAWALPIRWMERRPHSPWAAPTAPPSAL